METQIVEFIIQGGAVGIALVAMYCWYKTVTNHLNHANDTNTKLEIAITKLIAFLEERLK